MQSARKILENKNHTKNPAVTAVTAVKELNTTAVTADSCTAVANKRIDSIIDDFTHLTGGTANRMSGWYANMIRQLGVDKFIQLAKTAEQEGKYPAKYFSWLLANATKVEAGEM